MMENDIDKATSNWLKKLNLEEPSNNFSRNVMQSVYALENKKEFKFNYWWFLALIPVMIAGLWYLSTIPAFVEKLTYITVSIEKYYSSINKSFGEIFSQIKSVSISPMIILGFLAILSLLVIEDIFTKSKHTKFNTE